MSHSPFRQMIPLMHLLCVTVLLWLMPLAVSGNPPSLEAGMPNPPANPTVVKCAIMIFKVIDIDDVNESYEAEILILATWKDPRLAFDPGLAGTEVKLFQGGYQLFELYKGWWPQLTILYEVGREDLNAVVLRVFPDGTVKYRELRHALLETPMNLRAFPFDTQKLHVSMIPFANTTEKVVLEVDVQYAKSTDSYVTGQQDVNVSGWVLKHLDMTIDQKSWSSEKNADRFSRLTTTITIKRRSWQIVWSILFPLVIIVCTVWSIFWVNIESLHDRLNISFIGILTIVAYQFVLLEDLPRMSYLTFADSMLLISFFVMALTVPESLLIHTLVGKGRQHLALRVDRICRWAFPLVYVFLLFGTLAIYGIW